MYSSSPFRPHTNRPSAFRPSAFRPIVHSGLVHACLTNRGFKELSSRLYPTLLEKCSRVSQYLTDNAIAKLYICNEKFCQIEGNGRKFHHIELSNSVIR